MSKIKDPIKVVSNSKTFEDIIWVFDSLQDVIIAVLDKEFNITYANRAISKIVNLPIEDIIERNIDVLIKEIPILSDLIDRTLRLKKEIRNNPIELTRTDGKIRSFLFSTVIIKSRENKQKGTILIFHDISEMVNKQINNQEVNRYGEIIGGSKIMKELYSFIETIKDYDTSVLIYGETGTGKELIARSLHFSGNRRKKSFVPVHCAALSDNLIESELFGHVKGAYTGAIADRVGRFKAADGGSLFLDEIGSLEMDTQVKLLRATQEKEIEPVGSEERIPVDVRIISATNRDLDHLVQEDEFREDLYYRLKVLQIEVPPLRKRGDDIILLAEHFIKRLNRYYRKNILGITENTKDMLMHYPWPGNVRELENAIEHAFVIGTGGCLEVKNFPPAIRLSNEYGTPPLPVINGPSYEEEMIKRALLSAQGNKDKAAEILGMHRTTLWRKMKEYRIDKRYAKLPA